MGLFAGVADVYNESRHCYPPELRDYLVNLGALRPGSLVLDLGAGTGQLAMLAIEVAANVVAMDPESDMVRVGRRATSDRPRIRWVTGGDRDVLRLLDPPIDLVLIGNAFHHMDQPSLLHDLHSLISPAGTVVICSSSIPVWLQETDWSEALRVALREVLGRPVDASGVPDHGSNARTLSASPFSNVEEWVYERSRLRSANNLIGELVSSASGAIDGPGSELLRAALAPYLTEGSVQEVVKTTALVARR